MLLPSIDLESVAKYVVDSAALTLSGDDTAIQSYYRTHPAFPRVLPRLFTNMPICTFCKAYAISFYEIYMQAAICSLHYCIML